MQAQVIDVYSRRGCHLCEVLLEELLDVVGTRATIAIHDVDTRADWLLQYGKLVPVVESCGKRLCHYQLDADAVRRALAAGE